MQYLHFLAVAAAASAFPTAFASGVESRGIENSANFIPVEATLAGLSGVVNGVKTGKRGIENSANFVPIQGTIAGLSGVANGIATGAEKRGIENSANFIPIQGTIAGLSGVANGIATGAEKRGIENSANFVPIQGTIAGLSGVANGIATGGEEKRDLKNSANFVPIQATAALLSEVENGIKTGKRDNIENSANFIPIQATAALLSGVENNIATGQEAYEHKADEMKHGHHAKRHDDDIDNHANFIPIQATAALLSGVENGIQARAPLAAGLNGNPTDLLTGATGDSSPLKSLIRRYAADHDGRRPAPAPARRGAGAGMCSIGEVKCCNQVIEDHSKKEALAGLAGINDVLAGNIGLNCNSIPIIGATIQNQCKSSPVCCQNVTQDGLINFGCISLPIN
ncbi:uncharacterized protein PFL1_05751 [Pseudozyma flocculosa PF-1]|uniref:Hydrophobin n=1 Tax=Pseudozyma flocculosa PF-1 TaxID=1277687 RepID=A0A061H251_9BASI|nr:uncharacterized protein PFL1_05751 [Pseudozyma flocculosa PF-1]EPQ26772.1 hypothetical protein PFL1_05751 [Pseudozyma flocculosa PF-1]